MPKPIAWTIAGSDSGGGAGIQADLVTMNSLGVHGCSVVTAVTAQNTIGILRAEFLSEKMVDAQLTALQSDLPPAVIKIGMLGQVDIVRSVAAHLKNSDALVIYDPVMVSSSGTDLFLAGALRVLISDILPHVDLLTPNLPEAEKLAGLRIRTTGDMEDAAGRILKLGPKSVLVKGAHLLESEVSNSKSQTPLCQDFWTDGKRQAWFTSPRLDVTSTHGTGCTLSSAITAGRALGYSELDSIVIAKAYVNHGLRSGGGIGRGRGPLAHDGWPCDPADLPWITPTAAATHRRLVFPEMGEAARGVCPIVDRAAWLEKLLPRGVGTIQLRIKDLHGSSLEQEIVAAVEIAHRLGANLFINDYWQLAAKHGAYGVHLGQDDMAGVDWSALAASGMRVGLSASSFEQLARAMAVRPSCIGIGAVFATPSKTINHKPLGLEGFGRLRRLTDMPVIAIGGITLERAADVMKAGADGIAVISDILQAPDPLARTKQWLEFFHTA